MSPVLTVDKVVKSYNGLRAVNSISFAIEPGEMYGLLGPNGSGKTSLMRMIMNIIAPDAGDIHLFGSAFRETFKNEIGYLPEERGLYQKMRLGAHLQFLGEMKGLSGRDARRIAHLWLERFGLHDRVDKKIQELSKGLQQKVQFISTIMHSPRLVILDEPFSGLDPLNTRFLKDILLGLKETGMTIILSTHLMEQAEKLCDNICLINQGNVVLEGRLSEIKKEHRHNSVRLSYSGNGAAVRRLQGVVAVDDYGNQMEVTLENGTDPTELFKALAALDLRISRFEAAETSLNQIFLDLIGTPAHE